MLASLLTAFLLAGCGVKTADKENDVIRDEREKEEHIGQRSQRMTAQEILGHDFMEELQDEAVYIISAGIG